MKRYELMLLAITAIAATGCYTTTLKSGKPAGETPMEADERWHNGFVGGTSEASGPYRLEQICPNGWSEITTHTSFGNGILEVVSFHLYNPQTIDVKCAAAPEEEKTAAVEKPSEQPKPE